MIANIKQNPIEDKYANLSAKTPGAGVPIFVNGAIQPQNSRVAKSNNLLFCL